MSEPVGPYEEAERLALLVSLVTGLLTVSAAAAVAAWATGRALRPVEAMARAAAQWSEHDLGRRFRESDGAAPGEASAQADELGQLAVTLDVLLDRVTSALRSEQRLTAELAHELRTPLTAIRGEAELALLRDEVSAPTRDALESIVAASGRMTQTIATLLDLARTESGVATRSRCSLADVLGEVAADVGPRANVDVVIDVDDLPLALPQPLAVRALAPIVENAVRFAVRRVAVTGRLVGQHVVVDVQDDGPGVSAARAEEVFAPGVTSAAVGSASAGLGLGIARRIARSCGGDVLVAADSQPGASRFVVHLPAG